MSASLWIEPHPDEPDRWRVLRRWLGGQTHRVEVLCQTFDDPADAERYVRELEEPRGGAW